MNTNKQWIIAAKNALNAYNTYKAYCKALGRMNKLKSNKGKAVVMRAINHWRKEWQSLAVVEQSLRGV